MQSPNQQDKYYSMTNKSEGHGEVLIYDSIGQGFFDDGLGAKEFAKDLKALGEITSLDVRINSPGGNVFEGQAIYSQLKNHKAKKTVHVDGIAASIASIIAMAGDKIVMPQNAMMMIHDPSGVVMGTQTDMFKMADTLGKVRDSLVSVYANRTGLDREKIGGLMAEETWMSADDALALGFADEIRFAVKAAATFDLSQFKNAPKPQPETAGYAFLPLDEPSWPTGGFTQQQNQPFTLTIGSTTTGESGIQEDTAMTDKDIQAKIDDAVAQGVAEGHAAGQSEEAARVSDILDFQRTNFPTMQETAMAAIENGIDLDTAMKAMKNAHFLAVTSQAPQSAGGGSEGTTAKEEPQVEDLSKLSTEERGVKTWDMDAEIRSEFAGNKDAYLAFLKNHEAGLVKIKTGK